MSFDIALGRCVDVGVDSALVAIDLAALRRLRPGVLFAFPTKAWLLIPLSICSSLRAVERGMELFVDSEKVRHGGDAFLDYSGDGDFHSADIRLLAESALPALPASPSITRRATNWPIIR
jgi:hypothetical protein